MAHPKVSGILATFNGSATVLETIESIIDQSFTDWELIVVDDCSTDDTAEKLLSVKDPRVKVYRAPRNMGSGAARNWAVSLSNGEYLAIVDDDDISHPDRFLVESTVLDQTPSIELVSTLPIEFGSWGCRVMRSWPTDVEGLEKRIARKKTPVLHPATMLRRTSFDASGGYIASCRRAQDFTMMRHFDARSIVNLSTPLVKYRIELPLSFGFVLRNVAFHDLAIRTEESDELDEKDLRAHRPRVLAQASISWARRNLHHMLLQVLDDKSGARRKEAETLWATRY